MTADTARLRLGGSSLPPEESKKPLHSSQRPLALQSTTALQEITKTVHQFSVKSTKKGEAAQPVSQEILSLGNSVARRQNVLGLIVASRKKCRSVC